LIAESRAQKPSPDLLSLSFYMIRLSQIQPEKRYWIFLSGIIFMGALFRFRDLGEVSMTADEVSALLRIRFPSFGEMINGGVRPDGHPAFTQVLLWFWTKCFGLSPFSVRFPFALFGTASIFMIALIARKWFSESASLASAAGMALLKFPIMYSQLARPYAPALFFSLLAFWFLMQFLDEKKADKKAVAGFALALALAAYSHYFALLQASLFALIGILFAKAENRKWVLISCAGAILLFLPHLGIFFDQLSIGGIGGPGGWLAKPPTNFAWLHLKYLLNDTKLVWIPVLLLAVLSMILFYKKPNRKHVLLLLFWILPMIIGYAYSVMRNPVLQHSVLIAAFPFLLLLLFAWLPDTDQNRYASFFPGILLIAILFDTSNNHPYKLTNHFGRLKELVEESINWQKKYGTASVDLAYNVDAPYFVEYYYDQFGEKPTNVRTTINNGYDELNAFRKIIQESKADYFVYSWSTKFSPLEILPMIRTQFPYLVKREYWYNSAFYVFARNADKHPDYIRESNDHLFYNQAFFMPEKEWQIHLQEDGARLIGHWTKPCSCFLRDSSQIKLADSLVGKTILVSAYQQYDLQLDSHCVYSPLLRLRVGDIFQQYDNQFMLETELKMTGAESNVVLVIQFERDGKTHYWNGIESHTQMDSTRMGEWQPVYFGIRPQDDLRASDTVAVNIFYKNGQPMQVGRVVFSTEAGHTGIYGDREGLRE
jgi:Dolichyl-phosphate-mannose-protein mannosyltransferase